MARTLTVLFRRDPTRDRQRGLIHFEGYEILWTAIAESKATGDAEMQSLMERELQRFEDKFVNGTANGDNDER